MTVPPPQPPLPSSGATPVGRDVAIASGDGGVLDRLRRRTGAAAVLPLACAAALVVSGWMWPAWLHGWGGFVFGALGVAVCLLAAGVLLNRARRWRGARTACDEWVRGRAGGAVSARSVPAGWAKAVCTSGVPLHSGRGTVPMLRRERRFRSRVLPLKAVSGPLASGEAVVVHARPDGAMPGRGDQLQVRVLHPRGPILIGRLDDGAVFAADRWSLAMG
jgi:hypothetical protein